MSPSRDTAAQGFLGEAAPLPPSGEWPRRPLIYEVNSWVWLGELSRTHQRPVTLASVPPSGWDSLALPGVDAVWLMGVWERSPAGAAIARADPALAAAHRAALPDVSAEDVVGSPYCVRRYVADEHLGGPEGLAAARAALAARGLRLVLDFVPNHTAPDHRWVTEHSDFFLREEDGRIALGRDPHFPPWPDVLQLDAFHPGGRRAAAETLLEIAGQCDGVRCDMAMLLMNDVFARTWEGRVDRAPIMEYWVEVISAVRERHPGFLCIAEAYWDLEWRLQRLGFDYCYDKRLYDRLALGSAQGVHLHLMADLPYQERLMRFLENHDEPRAAAVFAPGRARAAAVVLTTLPGAKLIHEGQIEGRRVRLPVSLGRRPEEPADRELAEFYRRLLEHTRSPAFRTGEWCLCERTGWPDNPSHHNLVAWCLRERDERHLVVVNLSDRPSQAHVRLPWPEVAGRTWRLRDFSGTLYERVGDALIAPGFFVSLEPWGYHLLSWSP